MISLTMLLFSSLILLDQEGRIVAGYVAVTHDSKLRDDLASYSLNGSWPQFVIAFRGENRRMEPFGQRSALILDASDGPLGNVRKRVYLGKSLLTFAKPEGSISVENLPVEIRNDLAAFLWLHGERPKVLDSGELTLQLAVELRLINADVEQTVSVPLTDTPLTAETLQPLLPAKSATESAEDKEARTAARKRTTSVQLTFVGSASYNITDSVQTYQRVSASEFTAQFKAQDEFLTPRFPDGLRGERLEMAKLAPALRDEITKLLPPGSIPNEVPIRRIVKILWTDLDPNGKPNLKELRLSALPDWPAPPTTKS